MFVMFYQPAGATTIAPLNMAFMLVTATEMSALNDVAQSNINPMFVTELVSQPEMSALNAVAS